MVFVCSICANSINARPDGLPPGVDVELIGTKCRHLYHAFCLTNWFDRQDAPARACPKCRALLADADTTILRPCGDEEEGDSERFRAEAARAKMELENVQAEANRAYNRMIDIMEEQKIEVTRNDFLSREIEKLEAQHQEQTQIWKATEDSLKMDLTKAEKAKMDIESEVGYLQGSFSRQKVDFEEQLKAKIQQIGDLTEHLKMLRNDNAFCRRELSLFRQSFGHGHIDAEDNRLWKNISTQTENPAMENLEGRIVVFENCIRHLQSECQILENMRLKPPVSRKSVNGATQNGPVENVVKLESSSSNGEVGINQEVPSNYFFNQRVKEPEGSGGNAAGGDANPASGNINPAGGDTTVNPFGFSMPFPMQFSFLSPKLSEG